MNSDLVGLAIAYVMFVGVCAAIGYGIGTLLPLWLATL